MVFNAVSTTEKIRLTKSYHSVKSYAGSREALGNPALACKGKASPHQAATAFTICIFGDCIRASAMEYVVWTWQHDCHHSSLFIFEKSSLFFPRAPSSLACCVPGLALPLPLQMFLLFSTQLTPSRCSVHLQLMLGCPYRKLRGPKLSWGRMQKERAKASRVRKLFGGNEPLMNLQTWKKWHFNVKFLQEKTKLKT